MSKVRMAILKKVATCPWGLDANMLRMTGGALVASLLRYSRAVVGCGLLGAALSRFRAENGTLQSRLQRCLCEVFGMNTWEANSLRYHPFPPPTPHVGGLRYLDFDVGESWFFQAPAFPPGRRDQ